MPEIQELPLSEFYTQLATSDDIRKLLIDEFGAQKAEEALTNLAAGNPHDDTVEFIRELTFSQDWAVNSFTAGMEDYEFEIFIHKLGPLFWVSAFEFDNHEFFDSESAAMICACLSYSSFIEDYEARHG